VAGRGNRADSFLWGKGKSFKKKERGVSKKIQTKRGRGFEIVCMVGKPHKVLTHLNEIVGLGKGNRGRIIRWENEKKRVFWEIGLRGDNVGRHPRDKGEKWKKENKKNTALHLLGGMPRGGKEKDSQRDRFANPGQGGWERRACCLKVGGGDRRCK